MKQTGLVTRRVGSCLLLIVSMAMSASGQAGPKPQKKFLSAPLLIEDQGSFFVGGVPKVTDYATLPNNAETAPAATPAPHQITIGQMYVQYQVPARKAGTGWPVIMVHGSSHTAACLESTRTARRLVSLFRSQRERDSRRRSGWAWTLGIR